MACFTAPAAVAIIITSARKKIPAKYHIEWLITMLIGGVAMLIIEHIAHGEVVLYPPFFTAMKNPADISIMLKEIATTGTAMSVGVLVVWSTMVLLVNKVQYIKSRSIKNVTS